MGKGFGIWIGFLCLFSMGVEGTEVCRRVSTALAAPSIQYRLMERFPAALEDVLPDYDRTKEVLFTFNYHHTSLYFGKYFVDTGGDRENPRAIAARIVVKIHVGEEYVSRLEAAYPTVVMKMGTCELQSLYRLQQQGIFLNGFIPLTGLSLYEIATRDGFVDVNGKPFRHEVYALQTPPVDPITDIESNDRYHHVNYMSLFLGAYGLSSADFKTLVYATVTDPEIRSGPDLMGVGNEALHPQFTQRQRDFYLETLLLAEIKVAKRIAAVAGSTHNALAWAMQNGYPHAQAGALLSEVMLEALREVAAKQGIP